MVTEFHHAFGLAVGSEDTAELRALRATLLIEETDEVADALEFEELQAVAKELADVVYVAYGAAVSLGINLDEALRRVHASNMSKLNDDGSVSYRSDGKVLKSDRYEAPDMSGLTRTAA